MEHKKNTGGTINFPGAKTIQPNSAGLEIECDILIPAALENQIHSGNAKNIKAKVIAEAANGPVTPEAEKVLLKKGVYIIPDIFLNAGGVTVSYFEWLKNLSHVRFGRMEKRYEAKMNHNILDTIEQATGSRITRVQKDLIERGADERDLVYSGLEETMINAYNSIRDRYKTTKGMPDLRTATFATAIDKVAISYQNLGIFP